MRLIDADVFKLQVAASVITGNLSLEKGNAMCKLIDKQPVAYDLDKVIKDLEDSALAHAMNGQAYGEDGYDSRGKEELAIKRGIEVSIAIVKSKIRI